MAGRLILCVIIPLLLRIGAAQVCDLTHMLGSVGVTPILVNLTATSCFDCPNPATRFTLNFRELIADPPDVVISSTRLTISNWAEDMITTYMVTRTGNNILTCIDSGGTPVMTFFNTLVPGQLTLRPETVEPFYLENGNDTGVNCNNPNSRSGVNDDTQQWFNSEDTVVGNGSILVLPAVRANAGTYTCRIPEIPIIPAVTFEVVIYYAPEVSTNANLPDLVDVTSTLTLECSYVGFPLPNVTWTMNSTSSMLDSASNSDITITSSSTGSSTTTTLTWDNVPVEAQGTYYCLLDNDAGSSNGSYTIRIATTPESAGGFRVTGNTNTTISLVWDKRFNGQLTITGGDLEYFTGSDSPSTIMVSDTTAELTGLTPFQIYNITLFVTNRLGRSAPVSLIQQTDSNFLEAPMVNLTKVSSTELRLDWVAPAASNTVENASNWTVEFSLLNGTSLMRETLQASVLTRSFTGLMKGTLYRARVAGSNSRGMGAFSAYEMAETLVDSPSAPINVSSMALSSFAINTTWKVPSDMGGREVTNYQVNITDVSSDELVYSVTGGKELYRFVNDMNTLSPSTNYMVSVAGLNTAGLGATGTDTAETISIDQPQTVLETPPISNETNVSAIIAWTFPGGNVTEFLIVVTERMNGDSRNFTANGTETSLVLSDLRPATTYDVVIRTVNDQGLSMGSPLASFNTGNPPDPVITVSPATGPYPVRSNIKLTCTTPDSSRPIQWDKQDGPALNAPAFVIEGMFNMSTLTIVDAREDNSGTYRCMVGDTRSERQIQVFTPVTTGAPPSGISMMTIIIAACVGGGGGLILIVLVVIIVVLCCCCRNGDDTTVKRRHKDGYSPKKKAGKNFFEFSDTFTPTTNTGITRESNVSFTMPEEYNTHTSFGTEKQNKVERSHSPEVENPTSFGGNRASSNDYQMPPKTEGTML